MNADEGHATFRALREDGCDLRSKVLYIGWHPYTFDRWGGDWFLEEIRGMHSTKVCCTIVEPKKDRCRALWKHPLRDRHKIDIAELPLQQFRDEGKYNLSIWWHGPEHVVADDLGLCIDNLEACTAPGGYVVMGGPLGYDPDTTEGDSHEIELNESMFSGRGYKTMIIDRAWKNQPKHISAFKRIP